MNKYVHNAVSSDCPQCFKGTFSAIIDKKEIKKGKKLSSHLKSMEIIKLPNHPVTRAHCISLPPLNYDQDFDSINFSNKPDVISGIKDSIRKKSNFHQLFFEKIKTGFKKPSKQITFMQPIIKITRNEQISIQNMHYKKSISKLLGAKHTKSIEIDPGGKLLSQFIPENTEYKTPRPTKINFHSKRDLDIKKVRNKIRSLIVCNEIQDFESKIPNPTKNQGNICFRDHKSNKNN